VIHGIGYALQSIQERAVQIKDNGLIFHINLSK
jgi:hypothetical protein